MIQAWHNKLFSLLEIPLWLRGPAGLHLLRSPQTGQPDWCIIKHLVGLYYPIGPHIHINKINNSHRLIILCYKCLHISNIQRYVHIMHEYWNLKEEVLALLYHSLLLVDRLLLNFLIVDHRLILISL